jgi:hypothetical protein
MCAVLASTPMRVWACHAHTNRLTTPGPCTSKVSDGFHTWSSRVNISTCSDRASMPSTSTHGAMQISTAKFQDCSTQRNSRIPRSPSYFAGVSGVCGILGIRCDSALVHTGQTSGGVLDYILLIPSMVCGMLSLWQVDRMNSKVPPLQHVACASVHQRMSLSLRIEITLAEPEVKTDTCGCGFAWRQVFWHIFKLSFRLLTCPRKQVKLLEQRRNALNSEAENVFDMDRVPGVSQLVAWQGKYDHDASMCVILFFTNLQDCGCCASACCIDGKGFKLLWNDVAARSDWVCTGSGVMADLSENRRGTIAFKHLVIDTCSARTQYSVASSDT